jgi:hypothetical protein
MAGYMKLYSTGCRLAVFAVIYTRTGVILMTMAKTIPAHYVKVKVNQVLGLFGAECQPVKKSKPRRVTHETRREGWMLTEIL